MTKEDQILKRDKIFNEVQHLRNEVQKAKAALKTKEKELKTICPCNEREGYEYSVCIHCGNVF